MSDKLLIEQLKKIDIKPSLEWKEQTRGFLMSEIRKIKEAEAKEALVIQEV